ncbi:hypothetical protein C8R45DRAFT_831704 [Mycena sanguinolenta]|nr:hypothetical protein C8R45DRAFT_831704 [Mycena sanguinolenta]
MSCASFNPGANTENAMCVTGKHLNLAQAAASEINNESVPAAAIWKSTKCKDFTWKFRFFLWMMIHGGYKIGDHWKHIEGFEDWGKCKKCGITESMEHILTKCDVNGRAQVWDLASQIWKKKTSEEMQPSFGEIMACGVIKKGDAGTSRLYRLLMFESVYLIWKLRNERVIKDKPEASHREISNRWMIKSSKQSA